MMRELYNAGYAIHYDDINAPTDGSDLVKGLLPSEGVAVLYGAPGAYKSFIALDLACAVAEGRAWAGLKTTQGRVVYIAAEGAGGMPKRIAAYRMQHERATPRPFYLLPERPNLGAGGDNCERLIDAVKTTAGADPLAMIVIDDMSAVLGWADLGGTSMESLETNARNIAARLKCLVVLLYNKPNLYELISQCRFADTAIEISKMAAFSSKMIVHRLKDDGARLTCSVSLSRVVVGIDADGDEITSLVVSDVTQVKKDD